MKINYQTYPFLQDIENGTLEHIAPCYPEDTYGFMLCMGHIKKIWAHAAPLLRKNVCMPCKTYIDAIEKSSPCFNRLLDNTDPDREHIDAADWVDPQEVPEYTDKQKKADQAMYKLVGESYGCYLFKGGQMIVWGISESPEKHDFCLEIIGDKVTRCIAQYGEDYSYFVTNHPSISRMFKSNISEYPIAIISQLQHETHMFTMFERYARIETRYVQPKAKARIELNILEQSINETRLKINIRDSRYFTNIIRNEGFLVNGHLRLQPKKVNGEWTRELIYIDTFEKHGYHRNAKIAQA